MTKQNKNIIEFEYGIGDNVLLLDIEVGGVVDSLIHDCLGNMYRVAYWYNGTRNTAWVYKDEIKPIKSKKG